VPRTARLLQASLPRLTAFVLSVSAAGCAARIPPAAPPATGSTLAALTADLSAIFSASEFDRAIWGVLVQAIDNEERLFAVSPTKLMMPASNMKLLTLAASAERLGWDFTFETRLVTSAPIEEGTLKGDLIVVGSGDPSIGSHVGDSGRVLGAWADELWSAGLHTIDGRLIGDDNAFDDDGVGAGWSWDDLAFGYAAPVGALAYDENAVELVVRPAAAAGDLAELMLRPTDGGLEVDNHVLTSPPVGDVSLDLRRAPGTSRLVARGAVPVGTPEFARTVSVDNPTDFFLAALQRALIAKGIAVTGTPLDIDLVTPPPDLSKARVLVSHRSAPLSELAVTLMKVSRNLYGETLLKALGGREGRTGTVQTGREAVRDVLQGWGISPESVILSDGSGLSRYNYVTVDALVTVLRQMAREPRHAERFEATLPIAGRDGTLWNRMNNTLAADNVRAKTGAMTNVRALSGYVRTRDNERLAFSIVANNFNAAPAVVDRAVDRALERLASFSRK